MLAGFHSQILIQCQFPKYLESLFDSPTDAAHDVDLI